MVKVAQCACYGFGLGKVVSPAIYKEIEIKYCYLGKIEWINSGACKINKK
jgi:hypothetical protein